MLLIKVEKILDDADLGEGKGISSIDNGNNDIINSTTRQSQGKGRWHHDLRWDGVRIPRGMFRDGD